MKPHVIFLGAAAGFNWSVWFASLVDFCNKANPVLQTVVFILSCLASLLALEAWLRNKANQQTKNPYHHRYGRKPAKRSWFNR